MAPIVKRRKLSHSPDISEDGPDREPPQEQRSKFRPNRPLVKRAAGEGLKSTAQDNAFKISQTTTDDLLLSQSSHKSSLLKLQLDELLAGVRPDFAKQTADLQKPLFRLKEIIEGIPHHPAESLVDAEKRLKKSGIVIPFPDPRPAKDVKYKFEYFPPSDVNVVGNLVLKIGTKASRSDPVDLAVTLPSEALQEKDYLNHRYFHKRAFYVASIGAAIKKAAGEEFEISFELQDEVDLQPILIVSLGKSSKDEPVTSRSQIRIITAIPEDAFPLEKTILSKNCVRPKDSLEGANATLEPTPLYNSCLRSEASVRPYLAFLTKALRTCEALRDACTLATTWLNQRGFGPSRSSGGFGTFEFALVCALLLEGGGPKNRPAFSPRYNSFQIFKGVLQLLAGRDLCDPMVIGDHVAKLPRSPTPVLYDARRGVNILYKMSSWSYQLLKHNAQATLDASNDKLFDNFEAIFIAKLDNPVLRFDQLAMINMAGVEDTVDSSELYKKLHDVLTRGFGDRTRLIHLQLPHTKGWAINKPRQTNSLTTVEVGLLLEPDNASRTIDKGPMAEEKDEAEDFRDFWGAKAELRRFRDGTISETLVWSETDPQSITHQILSVLLAQHFRLPPSVVTMVGDHVERDVDLEPAQRSFQTVIETFQSFSSKLHSLEEIPLTVRSVSAADEALRFSSLQVPIKDMKPADIIIQFEGSSRWPDTLSAIQRTKIAFLTKIGDLLEAMDEPLQTRVGLENTTSPHLNIAFLDVFFPNGVIFRLRIQHEREQMLLQRQLHDKDLPGRNREEMASALAIYKRDYVHSAQHTQAIRSLCTRLPALSSTIRILKKWISSHLLTPFFSAPLLELFCAHVFLRPQPWSIPSTPFTAFLRVLLLISKWDWATEPLIVDFSAGEEMTQTDLANINTNFAAWRKVDPAMNSVVLFVASNLDPSGVVWTQSTQPPKVVALRLTGLARAAVSAIRDQSLSLDIPSLFQSPLSHFDFLIHLKPSPNTTNKRKSSSSKYKNLSLDLSTTGGPVDPDSIDTNPIPLFIFDLSHAFNPSIVLFFHSGEVNVDVIGGLWNPRTVGMGEREFRVRMGVSTMPVSSSEAAEVEDGEDGAGEQDGSEKARVEVNKKGMLAEMAMLGEGIVERVQVLKE